MAPCPAFLAHAAVIRSETARRRGVQCDKMVSVGKTVTLLAVLALCFLGTHSYIQDALEEDESNFFVGEQCIAKLDLPEDYDRLKLPLNKTQGPLDLHVEMDIRQVREVDESKKAYTLDVFLYLGWKDERLVGQTEKTNCNPVFPHHATPEFWIPGDIFLL